MFDPEEKRSRDKLAALAAKDTDDADNNNNDDGDETEEASEQEKQKKENKQDDDDEDSGLAAQQEEETGKIAYIVLKIWCMLVDLAFIWLCEIFAIISNVSTDAFMCTCIC